jgi:hypothetical protein
VAADANAGSAFAAVSAAVSVQTTLLLQVHGCAEAADAARVSPHWSQMLSIVWDTTKRPLLWFFTLVSLLHGKEPAELSLQLWREHEHLKVGLMCLAQAHHGGTTVLEC